MALRQFSEAAGTIMAYALAAVAYLVLSQTFPAWPAPAQALLVLAPLAAGAACLAAVRALPPSATVPWSLLAACAFAGALGAALAPGGGRTHAASLIAVLVSHALLAASAAWMIHQRDLGRRREILLDGALILAVGGTMLFRWFPPSRGGFGGIQDLSALDIIGSLAIPLTAVCGVTFAIVLLLARRSTCAGDCAAGIFGTSALLAISSLPFLIGSPPCCPVDAPYGLAAITAWGFLAFAGVRVVRGGAAAFAVAGSDPGGARLRQAVAPAAALAMALVITDSSFRPPMLGATAGMLALSCGLLAARVSHLLDVTRRSSAERRELKQTRALVEVSRALSSTKGLDETLEVVTQWACRLLDAQAAVLELLSEDGQRLVLRAASGLPSEAVGLSSPLEDSFTGWVVRHGKPRATTDPRREPDIQKESRPLLGKSPTAAAPLRYHDRTLGALACVAERPFDVGDLELLGALADQAAVAIENARLFKQVDRLSKTDPLTGLCNRRQLELDLAREFAAARRGRRLLAAMFDVNDFKEYNDRYGHVAGDEVLRLFGEVLRNETRKMNCPARYGGDEFVVLLTDTDLRGAQIFTERVRRQFSQAVVRLRRRTLSVSAGFAMYTPDMASPDDLIDAADRALYASKANKPRAG